MITDKPWYEEKEFQETFVGGIGSERHTRPNLKKIVEEAQRRGAERLAAHHERLGKITAGKYIRAFIMMKYVCRPNNCDRARGIGNTCECPESRVLKRVIMDIDDELEILNRPEQKGV